MKQSPEQHNADLLTGCPPERPGTPNMNTSRSKMVSFRLSPEEYQYYRHACASVGVRSLSELAREAIHQLVGMRQDNAPLDNQVIYLRDRLRFLSREVEGLAGRLDDKHDDALVPAPRDVV